MKWREAEVVMVRHGPQGTDLLVSMIEREGDDGPETRGLKGWKNNIKIVMKSMPHKFSRNRPSVVLVSEGRRCPPLAQVRCLPVQDWYNNIEHVLRAVPNVLLQ